MKRIGSVKEIADIISGFAFKSEWFGEGFDRIVRIGDLQGGNICLDDSVCVNANKCGVPSQYKIENGDILMALSGATTGKTAVACEKDVGAYINQRVAIIRGRTLENKKYLKHIFQGQILATLLLDAGGAAQANLSPRALSNLEIPIPRLEEQKRIAAILDKADSLRRKRQQALQLADDFLRATFLDLFGDPVTNPKGWPVLPLGSLCRIRRGGSPRPISEYLGGNIPWIKIGDASGGESIFIDSTKESIIKEGLNKTVLLEPGAMIFANCGVSLGFARILNIKGCIHDGWLAFDNFSERLEKVFLLLLVNMSTEYLRSIAPDGTQPNLNTSIMSDFRVILPPVEMQRKIIGVMDVKNRIAKTMRLSISPNERLIKSLINTCA